MSPKDKEDDCNTSFEPDIVPVFGIEINKSVARKILGRSPKMLRLLKSIQA